MLEWARKLITPFQAVSHLDEDSGSELVHVDGRSGLIRGTHVVSNLGWRPVETLTVGDRVLSFDNGMRPVTSVEREMVPLPPSVAHTARCPLLVPKGALRNRRDLWLLPDQGLLVESDIAAEDLGDPFAVVPAKSFAGYRGIELRPPAAEIEVISLSFQQDEVVYVEGGMLAHCPLPRSPLDMIQGGMPELYPVMPLRAAKFLVACHMDAEVPEGLTYHPEELMGALRQKPQTGQHPV